MKAWTAGGLRAVGDVALSPVQFELFTEAGAIVAERAVHAGNSRETVTAILRRAAQHSEALARAAERGGVT